MSDTHSKAATAMKVAWEIYREDQRQNMPRPFRECLKGAWKVLKKLQRGVRCTYPQDGGAYRKRKHPGPLQPGMSKARASYKAAYLTARIGR